MTINAGLTSALSDGSSLVLAEARFSALTTMRVGGPAEVLWSPHSYDALSSGLQLLRSRGSALFVLGGGSNLLVRDGGLKGVTLKLGSGFSTLRVLGSYVKAGAGLSLGKLVGEAAKLGLAGMEFAIGIPGTVGGAVKGNAGASRGCIGDRIKAVDMVDLDGRLHRFTADQIRFGYRSCVLPLHGVLAAVELQLAGSSPSIVRRESRAAFHARAAGQPMHAPSSGCIFKNPGKTSAGALIDRAGLKGVQIGAAKVSDIHANFIVNTGGASCSDVLRLMALIKQEVKAAHGIELEPEVVIVGRPEPGGWCDPWFSIEPGSADGTSSDLDQGAAETKGR